MKIEVFALFFPLLEVLTPEIHVTGSLKDVCLL